LPPRGWFSFERACLDSYRRCPDNLFEAPAFVLAKRTGLDNTNHVAFMGFAVLVVRHELRALCDDSLVNRMGNTTSHLHHDGLLHLGARHDADFFLVMPDLLFS